LFVDDELLNEIDLNETYNQYVDNKENSFRPFPDQGRYMRISLALGGDYGGTVDDSDFLSNFL
jgi:hypothetical protein